MNVDEAAYDPLNPTSEVEATYLDGGVPDGSAPEAAASLNISDIISSMAHEEKMELMKALGASSEAGLILKLV